ncbi:MAG: efflux RND transporter permease subunit [Nitrospirota bacterium]
MNLSRPFIERPVATSVLISALALFGWIAFQSLSVNDLPSVDFPTISVTANLPGANPETMAATVATPLERQFSQIAGLDSMSSVSNSGSTRISLQFSLSRDIDAAAQDVQNAIATAMRRLPDGIDTPIFRKVNPADFAILYVALTAKTLPLPELDRFADTHIAQRLSKVSGVAQVLVFGSQKYAVRIYLDPEAIAQRGLGLDRVVSAIQQANSNLPSGTLQGAGRSYTVKSSAQLGQAQHFNDLVVAYESGMPVRLSDIGRAEDSVEDLNRRSWLNGDRSIVLAVFRQPGSNTVDIARTIRAMFPEIEREAPPGVALHVLNDRSEFIRDSIHEVNLTLVLAITLVVLVILLFLGNARATLITALILPTSVLGTFAAMYLLGFSLNNLSLMALTLAVGFVVDDAIVVLENISRHMELGKSRMQAALEGTREIGFTVLSMTLSLAAVFLPIVFMPGILGRLFFEFAVTVGVAVLFSGAISLTLTPMLCSLFLRSAADQGRAFAWFERFFEAARSRYGSSLQWTMRHRGLMLVSSAGVLILTIALYEWAPKGFIPRQDMGVIFGSSRAPEGVTFADLVDRQLRAAVIIRQHPAVETVMASAGQGGGGVSGSNIGRVIIRLKPRGERTATADDVIQELRPALQAVEGLRVVPQNPPAIRIGGMISSSDYQLVLQGNEFAALLEPAQRLETRLAQLPILQDVNSDLELRNPEIRVDILRDRAAALGLTPQQIEMALYNAYGERQISTLYGPTDQYGVILQLDRKFQSDINALRLLSIQSDTGRMVPLEAVATLRRSVGPVSVGHYGQLPAVVLSFNLAPGVSIGEATDIVSRIASEELPAGVSTAFAGSAKTFQESFRTLPLLLGITILVIYMLLAILYEHYGHPLTILTALPFAGFGALLMLLVFGQELNIFSFVGLILLVGLVKKNGIMMVDFALQLQREKGVSPQEAIVEASLIRFRPIMMTTAAAIVATLPIALGWGAGAEARRPLGIAVVGGLVFSQLLTLYVTPTFYVSMERVVALFRRTTKTAAVEH